MSFDRLARHYAWMEWVLAGGKLQECRRAFLDEVREARRVLLAGEGHGRFLTEVRRVNREAAITCVDASAEMLRVAKERLRRSGTDSRGIAFEARPVLEFQANEKFDLVATHFFLDCFEGAELESVVRRIAGLLQPGGKWIVSDFQVPPRGWRRQRARVILWLAYRFFRVATGLQAGRLADPAPNLAASGLTRLRRKEFDRGLLYAELWRKKA